MVSDRVDVLATFPYALSNYQDTLLTHAFGNYRDLLAVPQQQILRREYRKRLVDAIDSQKLFTAAGSGPGHDL